MASKHPRLINFTAPMDAWLRERASREGVPVTELVRRALREMKARDDAAKVNELMQAG